MAREGQGYPRRRRDMMMMMIFLKISIIATFASWYTTLLLNWLFCQAQSALQFTYNLEKKRGIHIFPRGISTKVKCKQLCPRFEPGSLSIKMITLTTLCLWHKVKKKKKKHEKKKENFLRDIWNLKCIPEKIIIIISQFFLQIIKEKDEKKCFFLVPFNLNGLWTSEDEYTW